MIPANQNRPHFDNPPIFEQVISVAFDRIQSFNALDFGLFFNEISNQFPNSEMAAHLPVAMELFDGQSAAIQFELVGSISLPRVLYKNKDKSEMVQMQDDFFAFNWVKTENDGSYPRFEHTNAQFWKFLNLFRNFAKKRHGIEIAIQQSEITNVNIIPVSSFGSDYNDIANAFIVDPFDWSVPGLVAETYIRQRLHRIVDAEDKPIGRLHSNITPVLDENYQKAFKFELTARSGRSLCSDSTTHQFLDKAHHIINGAFMASVTDQMKKIWGEQNA
jgi:uncharacterized protein (TIGR04255 family)